MFVVCMNYFTLNWKQFMQNVHFSKKKQQQPCTVQLCKEINLWKWDEGGKRGVVVSKEVGVPSHLLRGIQVYKL